MKRYARVTAGTLAPPALAATVGVGTYIVMPTAIAVLAGVFVALVHVLVVTRTVGDRRALPVTAAASYLRPGIVTPSVTVASSGVPGGTGPVLSSGWFRETAVGPVPTGPAYAGRTDEFSTTPDGEAGGDEAGVDDGLPEGTGPDGDAWTDDPPDNAESDGGLPRPITDRSDDGGPSSGPASPEDPFDGFSLDDATRALDSEDRMDGETAADGTPSAASTGDERTTDAEPPREVEGIVERVRAILDGGVDPDSASEGTAEDGTTAPDRDDAPHERDAGHDEDDEDATGEEDAADGRDESNWVDQLESPDV